jgi:hypothetical protein
MARKRPGSQLSSSGQKKRRPSVSSAAASTAAPATGSRGDAEVEEDLEALFAADEAGEEDSAHAAHRGAQWPVFRLVYVTARALTSIADASITPCIGWTHLDEQQPM